jgi:hypothetical protein
MTNIVYKEYGIRAVPYQLAGSGEWTVDILIVRDTGTEVKHRKFGASNTYKSKDEAVQHCFNLGKQIIDGKVADCSVVDL